MIKEIGLNMVFVVISSLIFFFFHQFLLEYTLVKMPVSLASLYLFNGGFFLVLYSSLGFLSKTQKFKDQIGFLYLGSMILKIALFSTVFYKPIFAGRVLTQTESFNVLIVISLYIFLEIFLISKLLKNIAYVKKEK